jgi:hypothetical protein
MLTHGKRVTERKKAAGRERETRGALQLRRKHVAPIPPKHLELEENGALGAQFTCFTGTQVQILTQKALL